MESEPNASQCRSRSWPLERALFAVAGTMTIVSALLAVTISPWFLLLAVLVGFNQWLYVAVGACPASLLLSRVFGFRSAWGGADR